MIVLNGIATSTMGKNCSFLGNKNNKYILVSTTLGAFNKKNYRTDGLKTLIFFG
jgi:hypothetical protein